jgi:hypothetical protein
VSGDSLFPFPEPTFIFVHEVWVVPSEMLVVDRDERGKVIETLPSVAEIKEQLTPTKGYLTNPDETRDQSGYISRQQITAICAMPINTNVRHTDLILCMDAQLPPHLAGVYEIDTVRATIVHKRVMLRRYRLQFDEYGEVV